VIDAGTWNQAGEFRAALEELRQGLNGYVKALVELAGVERRKKG